MLVQYTKKWTLLIKRIIDQWVYKGGFVGCILIDLSKAYDSLIDDVLLAQEENVSIHFQPCLR